MQYTNGNIGLLILLIVSVALSACAPTGSVKDEPTEAAVLTDPDTPRAKALLEQGQAASAAQLFQTIAERSDSPAREEYLLFAAESWMQAQNPQAATELFNQIKTTQFPRRLDLRVRMLAAEIAISQKRGHVALEQLGEAPSDETPLALQRRYYSDKAKALLLSGNALESARALSDLDSLILDPNERLNNQLAILQTLGGLSDQALDLFQDPKPTNFSGWMELTRISRIAGGSRTRSDELYQAWRKRFIEHPAMPELLEQFSKQMQARFVDVETMAILLPLSGPYAPAASMLTAGIMAAYYRQAPEERPAIRFYDSSNPETIWPLYQQAIDEGANIVVGPLVKKAVSQLGYAGELPIPVLALNQIELNTVAPENFFQFSLAPEDEARQIAEKAWVDDLDSAVVFTPTGNWGDRIYQSFRDRWESLGGKVASHETYSPEENDFSAPIQRLLNLDHSKARHRELEKLLGEKLSYEPRRRQDAKLIVLAAKPEKARQIWPQFQFHHASRVPLYGTSHVYSGNPDPRLDSDINGVKFPDIPFLLDDKLDAPATRPGFESLFGKTDSNDSRLFAMGMDAYRLVPNLLRLRSNATETMDGATGRLFMDEQNIVHRQLIWAQIENGTPNVIGYAPRIDATPEQTVDPASTGAQTQPAGAPSP